MNVNDFKKLLGERPPVRRKKELYIQDVLEEHSKFIQTPGLLNHGLQFKCVISKFALDTTLITDFAYVTKSSVRWTVYLVELESPDKIIFKQSRDQIGFTSQFNDALAQIQSWKIFLDDNKDAVVKKLQTLMQPEVMRRNPVDFRFMLVYGRSREYTGRPERSKALANLEKDARITFYSYDSLGTAVASGADDPKNIMKLKKGGLTFKHLHCEPGHLFAFVSRDNLALTKEQRHKLKDWGYDIDAWGKGKLLTMNGRFPEGPEDLAREIASRSLADIARSTK